MLIPIRIPIATRNNGMTTKRVSALRGFLPERRVGAAFTWYSVV
jgi:hypothetical protein